MKSKTVNISMPEELLKKLDERAEKDFSSRSDYIRKAVINQLKAELALESVLNRANKKGKKLGITSEQQVYDIIEGRQN